MIPKEMKYNLHYGKVHGDVLPPPHGTNTICSVVKLTSKRLPLETKNTLQNIATPSSLPSAEVKIESDRVFQSLIV